MRWSEDDFVSIRAAVNVESGINFIITWSTGKDKNRSYLKKVKYHSTGRISRFEIDYVTQCYRRQSTADMYQRSNCCHFHL